MMPISLCSTRHLNLREPLWRASALIDSKMQNDVFKLFQNYDLKGIRDLLTANSGLANEGVPLPDNTRKGHPLHRICDAVFANKISDVQAIEIAKIFLEYGADIDGYLAQGDNNTPLIAAA